ncbi:hypothetical protein B0H13DRAFT_2553388 [Mycena leptocephala]|nr:hypothetical protein B0H13DRAFT_2553388 [Mycena leptocephala]
MNNPGTPGLRLLSLDGGGIRGLSMLIILEDLMWKLKVAEDLPDVPCPCDYFDLIGGTSTGGFVCAMNAANMSLPVLFRTYNTTNNPAMDCTIWQAGRATSAAPTFFKQIQIGPPGIEEAFVDGGMGQNNPIAALLLEAQVMFPGHQIACIISLGTGQPHTIKIPTPSLLKRLFPLDVIEAIKGIATDCEKEHQRFAHHFDPVPHVYFRFNVEQGMQDIQLNQWERLGDVAANTRQYLLSYPTQNQLVDAVKSLVEKIGRVSTQSLNAVPIASQFKQFNLLWLLSDVLLPPRYSRYFSEDIGERHIYVLHGLGGSGKTQIALKFLDMISRHQAPRFTKQFFINASSLQTLDTALKNIAIAHKIGTSSEDGLLWLISQREEWMLLFDNADNPSIDLFQFFPECTHGNIIITSRNPQLAVHGPRSHSRVGDMDEIDAIDLLLLSAVKEKTIESAQNASEIVKELSFLPLAIIQAGAYISKFDCLHRYLSLYRHNRAKLLSQHSAQSHDDYRWTVYTTWQISFGQLSKAAARFLQLCSLLHHDSIPESIFEQAAESAIYSDAQEAQTLQEARQFLQNFLSVSGTWDSQQFMDIIAEIQGYSLIDRHNISDTLSIHPLVHSWCRHTLDDEPIARECMIDIMGMSIRFTDDAYLFRNGLMSHVDSLIQDQMTIKSVFQEEYARVYFDSGRFSEAESLEHLVLEEQKQLLGADHPDTLLAMGDLAATYRELGRYQEAERLESIVLEKRKQLLGADHPHTLSAMANLAATYRKLGRCSVQTIQHTVGYGYLAATYRELGRYQEAEPLENIVLKKRKQLLGANHPGHCWLWEIWLSHTTNLEEAEPLDSIVLEKRKQLLGADHPDKLLAMENLAATYIKLGRYQEAEPLDSIVLEKRKQLLGEDHPDTLRLWQIWLYQEAEPLDSIVLEKRKQLLGADHPDTLLAMGNLAATYRKLGRYQEAEPLESIVLEKRKQVLGADHPDTLLAMANLATTYRELGRYQEAEPLEGIVLEKRKQLLGPDHPHTLYQEAEPLESIVLEKRKQLLGADHPETLSAMANLAGTYYELGRYKEAEPLESIVLEKRKLVLGPDHPHTLLAMENLAATYHELGRFQEAEYLQAQYDKLVSGDSVA